MAHRRRPARASAGQRVDLPVGRVPIDTGHVELVRERTEPDAVTVLVNGVPSSPIHLGDPTRLDFEYLAVMATLVDHAPGGPLRAVHLGAGACALPRWLHARRPGSRQVAVDVDAALLRLVRDWFDLPRAPHLRLRSGDARAVLAAMPDQSADLVVRDAFAGSTTPAPLTTTGFVDEVARVLRPGGMYLANCADRPPLGLARAELATMATRMDVGVAVEPGLLRGRGYGNLVLIGTTPGGPPLVDLTAPAPQRALRSLAAPVRLLVQDEAAAFTAGARPLVDPGPPLVDRWHA